MFQLSLWLHSWNILAEILYTRFTITTKRLMQTEFEVEWLFNCAIELSDD